MTVEEVSNCLEQIKNIILNSNSWTGKAKTIVEKCFNTAIKSLEAWEKIEKEIDDSILICREDAQNNDWYDGELAGFLQSKDIIDRNLSEVSE